MTKNIIKATCRELGITYRELGEAIGYSESAIKMAISNDKVSEPMQKAIELYLKTLGKNLDDADDTQIEQSLIKEVCSVLGITQKELADKFDLLPSAVSQWNNNDVPKTAKVALELMLENKQLKADIKTLIDAQAIAKKYS